MRVLVRLRCPAVSWPDCLFCCRQGAACAKTRFFARLGWDMWCFVFHTIYVCVCVRLGAFVCLLRQGVCQDFTHQGEIAKLLYFESNKGAKDELCSLDEYVSR